MISNMTKQELDALYADYENNGLGETCPADPGPERSAWQVKRLYLACRMMIEYLEQDRPEHMLNKAASRVGIATRQAGWAALEGAWREATQGVFKEAEEAELLESEMTHYRVEVSGRWANEKVEITKTKEVVFSGRIKEEDG